MKQESFDSLSEEIFDIFSNENIMFVSKPFKCLSFNRGDFLISLFGFFFFVFMIYFGYEDLRPHMRGGRNVFAFIFFDLPFIFLGLYMLFLRLIFRCRKFLNMVYILTDKRIAAFRKDKNELRYLPLKEIDGIIVEEGGGGNVLWFESDSFSFEKNEENISNIVSLKGIVNFVNFKDVDALLDTLKNLDEFKKSKAYIENKIKFQ